MDEQFIQTFVSELRLGFALVVDRLDQTNFRLDQTIVRLDRLDMNIELLRAETREKFDGIGLYLKSINGHILDHAKAISKLEKRVTDIEERD